MSVLLAFLNASRVSQLPEVCRKYFDDDDEEFIDAFGGFDDDNKLQNLTELLLMANIRKVKTDKEIARFFAMSMTGRINDYDDEAEPETDEIPRVAIPMVCYDSESDEEEVKPKPVMRSIAIQTEPEDPTAPAPAPKPKKPKSTIRHAHAGRPSVGGDYMCDCCNLSRASLGSLYNHYKSHIHKNVLLNYVKECRKVYKPDYKMVVKTLKDKVDNSLFMVGGLNDDYFNDLEDYIRKNEYDPITDVLMMKQKNADEEDPFSKKATWERAVDYS
jgi:hypothetical protein